MEDAIENMAYEDILAELKHRLDEARDKEDDAWTKGKAAGRAEAKAEYKKEGFLVQTKDKKLDIATSLMLQPGYTLTLRGLLITNSSPEVMYLGQHVSGLIIKFNKEDT